MIDNDSRDIPVIFPIPGQPDTVSLNLGLIIALLNVKYSLQFTVASGRPVILSVPDPFKFKIARGAGIEIIESTNILESLFTVILFSRILVPVNKSEILLIE